MEPNDVRVEHLLDGYAVTNCGEPVIERLGSLEIARCLAWFLRNNCWNADALEGGAIVLVRKPSASATIVDGVWGD